MATVSIKKRKAIALFSGGLDSALACEIMKRSGIEVEGVFFNTGFCIIGHQLTLKRRKHVCSQPPAYRVAAELGIPLSIIDISSEYQQVVLNPKHGYGKAVNPCIDCRIFMLKKAKELMSAKGGDFVVTGEVLGQRPMSQQRQALSVIEKECGLERLIVRPLSARLFPVTIPEEQGWISRSNLFNFNGRSRKPQLKLAKEFSIKVFMQPSGGCCFLTDRNFAKRLIELIRFNGETLIHQTQIELLKVGRHFRLGPNLKIIVGRDEEENRYLENFRNDYLLVHPADRRGPSTLVIGAPDSGQEKDIAGVVAAYCKDPDGGLKEIVLYHGGHQKTIHTQCITKDKIEQWRI